LKGLLGKVFADRGYVSGKLAQQLLEDYGIEFFAKPKRNMKNKLMNLQKSEFNSGHRTAQLSAVARSLLSLHPQPSQSPQLRRLQRNQPSHPRRDRQNPSTSQSNIGANFANFPFAILSRGISWQCPNLI
jgi:hypothetical protein